MTETPNIMSIRELIDIAFGDTNMNVVNHKLIQTILVILARQLRLLERRVEVEIGSSQLESLGTSSLSVTEVKLHANVPRKIKKGVKSYPHEGGGSLPTGKPFSAIAGKPVFEKTTSDKSSTEKSSTEKSSTEKSSTEKSSSGKTSSTMKSTTEPSSSLKTSSGKTKSSSDKTKTTGDKLSIVTKSPVDQKKSTSSDKASSEKTSSDKTTTEEKSSSGKTSTLKSSSDKTSSGKTMSKDVSSAKLLPQNYEDMLETIEEQRERELRIIHQRADSREERDKTPTPIASMESMEKQYEKLLIVERVPTGQVRPSESRSQSGTRDKPLRLSVVTQDEFAQLATVVRQLQTKFSSEGKPGFPENAQLLDDLRKGASLTDAMTALQLSARVEAAENALKRMMTMVTELVAQTPGININETMGKANEDEDELEVIFGGPSALSQTSAGRRKSTVSKGDAPKPRKSVVPKTLSKESLAPSRILKSPSETGGVGTAQDISVPEESKQEIPKDCITNEELDIAMQELYDEFVKVVNASTTRSNANANNALKIAHKLEEKLDESLDLGERMLDLEKLVSEYADQINILDTGLSSQMTYYQEQLTQMQHDLESGLETMAEALANTGGDTAAVAELNNHFSCLQNDIENSALNQKELRNIQDALSFDLQSLWKQIEVLRDTKSDRDEVADALKDKAGLAALNGLVSRQEFDAVRGDFEKRIGLSYDKFNNQEIVWQKAIDDLLRELSEKADWIQLVSLQASITEYVEKLRNKIQAMSDVVGEPRAAGVTRKLHREADCLSCSTPAHMDLEESKGPPLLPAFGSSRPPTIGAEAESKPAEDGDHGACYPGLPVPHAVDSRTHVCHRYCGGSHTLINNTISRVPVGMTINPALRKVSTALGTDGKLYLVDNDKMKKPCVPCNLKKPSATLEPSEAEPAPPPEDYGSGSYMMSSDFRSSMQAMGAPADSVSLTPPPPLDEGIEN